MSGTYIRGALALTMGLVAAVAILALQGNDRPALANHDVEFGGTGDQPHRAGVHRGEKKTQRVRNSAGR